MLIIHVFLHTLSFASGLIRQQGEGLTPTPYTPSSVHRFNTSWPDLNKCLFVEFVFSDYIVQTNLPPFITYLRANGLSLMKPGLDESMSLVQM